MSRGASNGMVAASIGMVDASVCMEASSRGIEKV